MPTYLADSQQFALEFCCRLRGTGAYYVMPSFRGEDNDARHLAQFVHSEAELPGTLDATMETVENYLRSLASFYLDALEPEIASAAGTTRHLRELADGTTQFTHIAFADALRILDASGIETHESPFFRVITGEGESRLMHELGEFVWLTDHDALSQPFYQRSYERPDGTAAVRNADLLFGIGETVGAGERQHDTEALLEALRVHGVDAKAYDWYVEMRRLKPMQTSGFGMGVERFHLWALRRTDIRDMQLLLRENGRSLTP